MASETLWVKCTSCGKVNSAKVKTCVECGSKVARRGYLKWLGGGALAIVVLAAFAPSEESSTAATQDTTTSAAIARSAVVMPARQSEIIQVVGSYKDRFNDAKNELQQSTLRDARRGELLSLMESGLRVESWIGTISRLETNSEGMGILAIRVSPETIIQTWNNGLSDLVDQTMIEKSSSVYASLMEMGVGDQVRFSGSFLPSDQDGIGEASVTIRGSMTNPEFLFHFTEVSHP